VTRAVELPGAWQALRAQGRGDVRRRGKGMTHPLSGMFRPSSIAIIGRVQGRYEPVGSLPLDILLQHGITTGGLYHGEPQPVGGRRAADVAQYQSRARSRTIWSSWRSEHRSFPMCSATAQARRRGMPVNIHFRLR